MELTCEREEQKRIAKRRDTEFAERKKPKRGFLARWETRI
jgi:hypothetical protein